MRKIILILLLVVLVGSVLFLLKKNRQENGFQVDTVIDTTTDTIGPGDYEFMVSHQERERTFLVHVPSSYTLSVSVPAVLFLHGGGGNALGAASAYGFLEKADEEGFIVVYPEGTSNNRYTDKFKTWNAGDCSGIPNTKCASKAAENGVDDVGYIHKVLDTLESKFNVDTERIYVAGHSNGGQMTHRLGCEMSERIAAIASVSGTLLYTDCKPTRAIPVLNIYARNDGNVPYEGGRDRCTGSDFSWTSVAYTVNTWKDNLGVKDSPVSVYENNTAHCESYRGYDTELQLCTIEPDPNDWQIGGHSWPGVEVKKAPIVCPFLLSRGCACVSTDDLDATDYIWDFFKRHSL